MRTLYLVCYDICSDKRLRKVHKTMRGYGDPVQNSVFLCELSRREKAELTDKLNEIIHHQEDQVMYVHLGPSSGRGNWCIETLGQGMTHQSRSIVVV